MDLASNITVSKVKDKFTQDILETAEFRNEISIIVNSDKLLDILRFLHDDRDLAFNFLADITAVDWFQRNPRFDVVYHLRSLTHNFLLRIKTQINDGVKLASATSIWQTANWLEREVYDLFGIEFENHPDLRRILTPDHWENHPLRKDYPLTGKNEPLFFPTSEDVTDREI